MNEVDRGDRGPDQLNAAEVGATVGSSVSINRAGRLYATHAGVIWTTLALAAYIMLAIYAYWPASDLSTTQLVGGGIGDSAGQANSLAWTPFALLHHLNPFITNWINYPTGVNLASNAFAPVLGIIAWPVTASLGPIAAVNFIFPLAFATSAAAMFFVLVRITRFFPGAFLGGLLYGFSPYMVGEGLGHMAILFVPIPPIVFLLISELLSGTRLSERRIGIALGGTLAIQVYIAVEIVATMAVLALIALVVVAIARWREIRTRLPRVLKAGAWSAGVFALLAGYLIWAVLAGPLHLSGPPQPLLTLDSYRSDLLGPIVPTVMQRLAPMHLASIGSSYASGNISENGIYIGIPLLLGAITLAIVCWRNLIVRICLILAAISFLFSLGPFLFVNNYNTGVRLPFDLLLHVPLLSGEVPGRYSLFVDLFLAVALGVGIADISDRLRRHRPIARTSSHTKLGIFLPSLVAAATLVPLIPTFPIATSAASVPPFFSSKAVNTIPTGSVLLAYPYPEPGAFDQPMLWQAIAENRFKLVGGYAIFRGVDGAGSPYPDVLQPSIIQNLFDRAYFGSSAAPGAPPLGPLPRLSARTVRELRTFLHRYHVWTVAAVPMGDDPALALSYLRAAIGPPISSGGMRLWFDVPRLLRHASTAPSHSAAGA